MDFIDTLDNWLEDRWRDLRRPWSPAQRRRRARWAGVASLSLALHLGVLLYFGSQLTDAYTLPEPPPEIVEPVEPVEAILIPPPPEETPPPEPTLRRLDPLPLPTPQPTPQPTPPVPTPPTPTPPAPKPAPTPPNPAPPRPAPLLPIQAAPAPPSAVTATIRPLPNLAPVVRPTLPQNVEPDPTPPAAAPPAPRPAPPSPAKKKEDEDEDKPIARTTPSAVQPRQVAPSAPPSTVAPLPMAPVPRAASAPSAGGGANRPPPPGGANGDFRVRPSGVVEGGLRGALRGSTVGCDHRTGVALNKDERVVCDERVGERGAKAPPIAVGTELSREKRGRMQTQTELNEAMRAYKGANVPTGTAPTTAGTLGPPAPRIRDRVGQ